MSVPRGYALTTNQIVGAAFECDGAAASAVHCCGSSTTKKHRRVQFPSSRADRLNAMERRHHLLLLLRALLGGSFHRAPDNWNKVS